MPATVLEAVKSLGPTIADAAARGEQLRRMEPGIVEALRPTRAFSMLTPTAYGGPGMDPLGFIDVVDEAAYWDGSTGWCVMNSVSITSTAALFEPDVARTIFGEPNAAFAGAAYPSGRGTGVEGG